MAAGAASGAGAGMAAGPWGAAIGAVAGGVMGGLSGETKAPTLQPPAAPTPYGAINSQNGGWYQDPVTGAQYFVSNDAGGAGNYDQYRNSAMMSNLLGGNGQGAADQVAQQIAIQQALVDRLSNPTKTGTAAPKPEDFGIGQFLTADGKMPDISDTNAIFDGRVKTPEAQALVSQFQKDTGGNYGGAGAIGFGKWVRDFSKQSLLPKFNQYQEAVKATAANTNTNDTSLEAAKLKLSQLQSFQKSTSGVNQEIENNPILQSLKKTQPEVYQQMVDSWKEQAATDQTKAGTAPAMPTRNFSTGNDWTITGYNPDGSPKYGPGQASTIDSVRGLQGNVYGANRVGPLDLGMGNIQGLGGSVYNPNRVGPTDLGQERIQNLSGEVYNPNRVGSLDLGMGNIQGLSGKVYNPNRVGSTDLGQAGVQALAGQYNTGSPGLPTLDPNAGAYARQVADFTTNQTFQGQRQAADQQAAARGMLSSAVNEVGRGADSLALGNALNQNAYNALNYNNQLQQQQFGNRVTAQQAQNAALTGKLGALQTGASIGSQQFGNNLASENSYGAAQNQALAQQLGILTNAASVGNQQFGNNLAAENTYGNAANQALQQRLGILTNAANVGSQQFGNNLASENAYGSAQNQALAQRLGILTNAASVGNQQFGNNLASENAFAGQSNAANQQRLGILGATADLENQQFGRAANMNQQKYSQMNNEYGLDLNALNLQNTLQNQWRNNYLQSLQGQAGAVNQQAGWDQQKFANQTGFLNQLNGMNQQNFGQNMANQQQGLAATQTGLAPSQNWANAQTSFNNALSGNQNQAALFGAQLNAQQQMGNQAAMWQGLGNIGTNYMNWQANQPQAQADPYQQTASPAYNPNTSFGNMGSSGTGPQPRDTSGIDWSLPQQTPPSYYGAPASTPSSNNAYNWFQNPLKP